MIAKLIVHGEDRAAALRRLTEALAEYEIVGVESNVAFLRRVVAHDAFANAKLDTGLIARHHAALFPPRSPLPARVLLAAALAEVLAIVERAATSARASADPYSPWGEVDPWWPNSASHKLRSPSATANRRIRSPCAEPTVDGVSPCRRNFMRLISRRRSIVATGACRSMPTARCSRPR
jgi:acetyl/propionyl-CoA carboxylase alpha subunit